MSIHFKEGGPFSLYCDICHCWVPNTANTEMKKEGVIAYSHCCGNLINGEIMDTAYVTQQEEPSTDPVIEKIENMISNVQSTIDFKARDNEMRMKRLRMLVAQADAESVSGGTLDSTIEEIRVAECQIGAMQDQIGMLRSFKTWYEDNGYTVITPGERGE